MTQTKPRHKYTADQIEQAIDLREAGLTWGQIALKTGMTIGSASYHCELQGVTRKRLVEPGTFDAYTDRNGRHCKPITAEEDELILRLRKKGLNIRQICEATGRAANTVRYRIRREGLAP